VKNAFGRKTGERISDREKLSWRELRAQSPSEFSGGHAEPLHGMRSLSKDPRERVSSGFCILISDALPRAARRRKSDI
jgi:hypothetical protein